MRRYDQRMGNREDLLAGAKQCLRERGWARTTVRDIAAAAGGVSHAAIGYHFGSREVLLTAAFTEALDEWGMEIGRAQQSSLGPNAGDRERYVAMWSEMIKSFTSNRALWTASAEAFVQSEHNESLREHLAAAVHEGRRGMAATLAGIAEEDVEENAVRTVGSVSMALISGIMLQCLVDDERAPTAAEIVEGIQVIVAGLNGGR